MLLITAQTASNCFVNRVIKRQTKGQKDPGSYWHKRQDLVENKHQDNLHENLACRESIGNEDVAAIPHFQLVSPGGKAADPRLSEILLQDDLNRHLINVRINYRYFQQDDIL